MSTEDKLWPTPRAIDQYARRSALSRLDDLTKPQGSLGHLEEMIANVAGIQGREVPSIVNPYFLVFAADHGVAKHQSVSRYEQSVTEEMCVNIAMGSSVSAVLAREAGISLRVIDVGVARKVRHPNVIVHKKALGTKDMTTHPAMDESEFRTAFEAGLFEASRAVDEGADCLILGEMGIGNTTAASALTAWLLNRTAEEVVGRGTGIDEHQVKVKTALVEGILVKFREFESTASARTKADMYVQAFCHMGGFELVAMAGAMLAACAHGVPVLLDGVLAGVSALWTARVEPEANSYFIAGHLSPEPAHAMILDELKLSPIISAGLRVGEGTGALFAWPVLKGALKVMAETATFAEARVTNPHKPSHGADTVEHSMTSFVQQHEVNQQNPVRNDFTEAERSAVYKAILARRDIRVFLPDAIDADILHRIMQAGHHGPSVGYMQPWNFIVITDMDLKRRLQAVVDKERIVAGEAYPDEKRDYYLRLKVEGLTQAPVTICVTNDSTRGGPNVLGRNTIPETDLMSTSCAIQNMWLAARAEGIGMGWVSIYQKDDVRDILNIPPHIDPSALLSLGYTPHFPDIPVLERVGWGKRLPFESMVYHDYWDRKMEEFT